MARSKQAYLHDKDISLPRPLRLATGEPPNGAVRSVAAGAVVDREWVAELAAESLLQDNTGGWDAATRRQIVRDDRSRGAARS